MNTLFTLNRRISQFLIWAPRMIKKMIKNIWYILNISIIIVVLLIRRLSPKTIRYLFERSENFIIEFARSVGRSKKTILFLKEEYFNLIDLVKNSTSASWKFLWKLTPQPLKPNLMQVIPFFISLKNSWLWFNRAILKVLEIILDDFINGFNWLKNLYFSKRNKSPQ